MSRGSAFDAAKESLLSGTCEQIARDGSYPDLDPVLNDPYGLSEDLDNARDWLADHWPGDLPAPRWFANGDQTGARPAVTVLAYCRRSELARAAELLDAQVVDAPREAGPWRWAVRDFGRVRIEAYCSAGPVSHLRACVHGHPRPGRCDGRGGRLVGRCPCPLPRPPSPGDAAVAELAMTGAGPVTRWRDYRPWRHEIQPLWRRDGHLELQLVPRRAAGSPAAVADYRDKLTALMALEHDDGCAGDECVHYLERNSAAAEASQHISARQERQVRRTVWSSR